jgi:glycosyltransferase involved in cell wall biosynthesis
MLPDSRSFETIYQEHPIAPVPCDPLEHSDSITHGDLSASSRSLVIGFACQWEDPPERTWSGSAWNLRAALSLVSTSVDIGIQMPRPMRVLLRAGHIRFRGGRLTSPWTCSRVTDVYNASALRKRMSQASKSQGCDAVLMVDDLAILPVPFFVYYDSSWDSRIAALGSAKAYAAHALLRASTVERRRERQVAVYGCAAGVVAMSRWLARSLVTQSGVPASKVHVVYPGISAGWALEGREPACEEPGGPSVISVPRRLAPRRRLLFVCRQYKAVDFYRKGGDLVIAALAILRREYDLGFSLTIVGLEDWPLRGSPPEGVQLLRPVSREHMVTLYDEHDLLVMPSRMEPFGLVFIEALARGMPCIGRFAYAMPEIITPGLSGALIHRDDPYELASAIIDVVGDENLYETCWRRAPIVAGYFSWSRAAVEMRDLIGRSLGNL